MKKIFFICCILSLAALSSCKKEAGTGGTSKIVGRVFGYDINNSGVLLDSAYLGDVRVYLSYADNSWPDKDERTSNTGHFAFQGLQKGKYRVFVFTKCVTCPFQQDVVEQFVEIKSDGETVTLVDLKISD